MEGLSCVIKMIGLHYGVLPNLKDTGPRRPFSGLTAEITPFILLVFPSNVNMFGAREPTNPSRVFGACLKD